MKLKATTGSRSHLRLVKTDERPVRPQDGAEQGKGKAKEPSQAAEPRSAFARQMHDFSSQLDRMIEDILSS